MRGLVHSIGRSYIRRVAHSEAETQKFTFHNERLIEFGFVFDCLNRLRPQTVLDVGSGTTALPALIADAGCVVTAIDNVRDYWTAGMVNRHWDVLDDDIRAPKVKGPFDMVTCISVLEHVDRPVEALQSMARLISREGAIVLTMPYSESRHVADVYALPGCHFNGGSRPPYITRSANRADLTGWLRGAGLAIAEQRYWRVWSGEVWRQGEWLPSFEEGSPTDPHQLTCLLLQRKD